MACGGAEQQRSRPTVVRDISIPCELLETVDTQPRFFAHIVVLESRKAIPNFRLGASASWPSSPLEEVLQIGIQTFDNETYLLQLWLNFHRYYIFSLEQPLKWSRLHEQC